MTHVKFYHSVTDRHCANCEREIHATTQYGRAIHTFYGELQERILCKLCADDFQSFANEVVRHNKMDIDEILFEVARLGDIGRRESHYDDLMHRERELT